MRPTPLLAVVQVKDDGNLGGCRVQFHQFCHALQRHMAVIGLAKGHDDRGGGLCRGIHHRLQGLHVVYVEGADGGMFFLCDLQHFTQIYQHG